MRLIHLKLSQLLTVRCKIAFLAVTMRFTVLYHDVAPLFPFSCFPETAIERGSQLTCLSFPWSPAKQEPQPETCVQDKDLLQVGKLFSTFLLPFCFNSLTPSFFFFLPGFTKSLTKRVDKTPLLPLFFSYIIKHVGYFANIINFFCRGIFIYSFVLQQLDD